MSNAVVLATDEGPQEPHERHLVSVPGTGWQLPEMTPTDARRLAVALLQQAEEEAPSPPDVGQLPYGWMRLSVIVPSPDMAPVIEKVQELKRAGLGKLRISNELNARGLKTQTGGNWHPNGVMRLLRSWPQEARKRWTVPTVHRLL